MKALGRDSLRTFLTLATVANAAARIVKRGANGQK